MTDPAKVVRRKCRWCGKVYRVPPDYPKRQGCPECAPTMAAALAVEVARSAPPHVEGQRR